MDMTNKHNSNSQLLIFENLHWHDKGLQDQKLMSEGGEKIEEETAMRKEKLILSLNITWPLHVLSLCVTKDH